MKNILRLYYLSDVAKFVIRAVNQIKPYFLLVFEFTLSSHLFQYRRQTANFIFKELVNHHELLVNYKLFRNFIFFETLVNILKFYVSHKLFLNSVSKYLGKVFIHINFLYIFHVNCQNICFNNFEVNACFKFVYILLIKEKLQFFELRNLLLYFMHCHVG